MWWTPSPTISSPPTESFHSSSSPTSSLPTVSSQPTITCYWVDIVVVFDAFPLETSWQIEKIINSGDNKVLKTFNGTSGEENELRNESMCLEGEKTYQFTIHDSTGDGICCGQYGDGRYNVTSNGSLIVEGGEFGLGEVTTFSIPFVPGTAISNSIAEEPITSAPTKTWTYFPTPFPTESSTISPPTELFHPSSNPTSSSAPTTTAKALVTAVDDIITLPSGTSEAFIGVLDNDMGENLLVRSIISQPSNGKCSISLFSLSEVVYTPNDISFIGSDQCTYEACDEDDNCDMAVVGITIGDW